MKTIAKSKKDKKITKPKSIKKKVLSKDFEQKEVPIDESVEEGLSVDLDELSEGDDPIEMDILEGDKIVYGSTFSPMDGNEGDESEDIDDLPDDLKSKGHRFDPTLSSGGRYETDEEQEEWEEGLYINEADGIGLGYGDNDYSEEEEY